MRLVDAIELRVEVGWHSAWERAAEAVDHMRERRVAGEAILDVTRP